MSKRNFILLIIVLIIALIVIFGFLYSRQRTTEPTDEGGINFLSKFNPFGDSKTPAPPSTQPPVDLSPSTPPLVEEISTEKLQKVSSMPVAGFGFFIKERLKEIPTVAPATTPGVPYSFGTTTLKEGSTGDAVKEIQRFLNNTLNLSLELDGILDMEIVTAIKQWQSNNGLVVDGIVGAKTKAMMYSSVNQITGAKKPTPPMTEFSGAVRYIARAEGIIYETFLDKIEERKFSTTIIPKIYETYFSNHKNKKGESVIMRYLKTDDKTIETFLGVVPKDVLGGDTGNNEIKGAFLPDNITDVSISPDTTKIFYLLNVGDNIVGTVLNLLDNKKAQVFDSPFTEWLSFWPNSSMITLTTKPSFSVPGHMYTINPGTKSFNRMLSNVNGLTTLTSPDGKSVLYGDNNLSLSIYHVSTKVSDILGIRTLPEKCVWGKGNDIIYCAVPTFATFGQYPDTWYQGEVSFSDQIWKINTKDGNATMLLDPATAPGGEEVDGIKLALDANGKYLFFVNKKDSFLWKLDLQ